jgi:hypothetical protein
MYENDILDLDTLDDLEQATPIKSNKAIKKAIKKPVSSKQSAEGGKSSVITKPVEAACNKCARKVVGELVADIYLPHTDKMVPLISYTCLGCGHIGRRSVMTLALPLDQYERKYFN